MTTTTFRHVWRLMAATASVLLMAACSNSGAPTMEARFSATANSTAPTPPASMARTELPVEAKAVAGAAAGRDALSVDQGALATAPSTMLIRTGTALVQVDSVDVAIARLTAMAQRLGGFVANTSVQSGESQVRSATLELKIPVTRFDDATAGLAPLGKVEAVNSQVADVGEEYVDLAARTANARRLEARLVQLLAERTGKLEDVLNVERELARVREEIERFEGRLRYLRTRVAMSTLTVTVHEKAPVVSPNPDQNVLGAAAVNAWRNFVFFLAGLISALGWLIPAGGIVGIVVLVVRRWIRRRSARVVPIVPKEA